MRNPPPRVREVIGAVAVKYGLEAADITGSSVERFIAFPRQEAYWRLRQLSPQPSYPSIGRWMGRDHSTVISGIRAYAKRMGQGG